VGEGGERICFRNSEQDCLSVRIT